MGRPVGVDERQCQIAVRSRVGRILLGRALEEQDGVVHGACLHGQQPALERRAAAGGKEGETLNDGIVDGGRGFVCPLEMEADAIAVAEIPPGQSQRVVNAAGGGR